jgi:hypothetical protein
VNFEALKMQHTAEIIYCRERARLAREKADAATTNKARDDHLAAEARWLALVRSYELQQRLSRILDENEHTAETGSVARMAKHRERAFDPDVVDLICSPFRAVVADLGLSDRDEVVALRAARRIINLAAAGERDSEGLRAAAGAVRDVVGISRGAVSGQLMVSDQAARSIG